MRVPPNFWPHPSANNLDKTPFMTELSDRLESLGLTQYLEAFVSEGFDSWETIQDITESDL